MWNDLSSSSKKKAAYTPYIGHQHAKYKINEKFPVDIVFSKSSQFEQ